MLLSFVVCEFYRDYVEECRPLQKRSRVCPCSLDGNTISVQSNTRTQYIGVTIVQYKISHLSFLILWSRTNSNAFCFLFILNSASRGKGMERVSLPPPQYGAASFNTPKTSRSNSFHPSAPSSGRDDTVAERAPPETAASDNLVLAFFLIFSHIIILPFFI